MGLVKANATLGRKLLRQGLRKLAAPLGRRTAGPRRSAQVGRAAGEGLALDPGARLVAAARKLKSSVRDNKYSHDPTIVPEKGVFHGDCSDFIGYLLGKVNPKALKGVPVDAGRVEPRARDYFAFFKDRPLVGGGAAKQPWGKVRRPADLRPGDIVAWKNEAYVPGKNSTGHVMLVTEAPRPVRREGKLLGYDVPIIDSTSHGHGLADPRKRGGQTGLGSGAVFFPTDEAGLAIGFSWNPSVDAAREPVRPPILAFGRLLE